MGIASKNTVTLLFMFSTFSVNSIYINLPVRLAKKFRRNKRMWDLLVLAICMKLNDGASGLYIRTPRDISTLFHCSYRKAERLMKMAMDCPRLFHYNPKTHFLSARTFVVGCSWFEGKNGKRFYHDTVITVRKASDGTISHNEISKQLRDKMMLKAIEQSRPRMSSNCQSTLRSETSRPLTQKFLGNIAGCHRSTVSRHLRKVEGRDEIKITVHDKIPVYDVEHGVEYKRVIGRRPFISGRIAYIRDANDYEILVDEYNYCFKHIIYNHPQRLKPNRHNWSFAQYDL